MMIWQTILIATIVFAIALSGMAIGVIVSNRRLRGSCGGLANLRDAQGRTLCDACTNPAPDCTGIPTDEAARSQQPEQCTPASPDRSHRR